MSTVEDHRDQPFPPGAQATGLRRRRAQLNSQVNECVQRARMLMGDDLAIQEITAADAGRAAEVVSTLTWLAIERLRETRPGRAATAGTIELVCDLQRLATEMHEHAMTDRTRRVAVAESGLASLRAIPTTEDLLDRVCKELVRSGGFGRALLSRVEDGVWMPWVGHFSAEMPEFFDTWMDTRIPLDEMTLETQLLGERRPALVHDTSADDVHEIVRDGMSSSYVVAPVMPAGEVVGFLHADHHPSNRRCDEIDRDVLWTFAEGFGLIYERTVLNQRMRSQRDEIRDLLESVSATMEQLCDAEIELAAAPTPRTAVARAAVSVITTMSANLDELTPREAEVLALMVAGAKNSAIAEKLVITEGTVKSHVKHILRKLGAVNRSQAIAHYLGVTHEQLE